MHHLNRFFLIASLLATVSLCAQPAPWTKYGTVYEWTKNGQITTAPHGTLTNVVQVSAGSSSSRYNAAVRNDGTFVLFGDTPSSYRYTLPAEPITNCVYLALGWLHGAGIRSDGSVFMVGGALLNAGDTDPPYYDSSKPWTNHVGYLEITNAVKTSSGDAHVAAVQSNGVLRTWGYRPGVVAIDGLLSNVVDLASTWYGLAVVFDDGTMGYYGPTQVEHGLTNNWTPSLATNVAKVACGQTTVYFVRNDGTTGAWGRNDYGQCDIPLAAQTNVVEIAAGRHHAYAVLKDGTLVGWGGTEDWHSQPPQFSTPSWSLGAGQISWNILLTDGVVPPNPPAKLRVRASGETLVTWPESPEVWCLSSADGPAGPVAALSGFSHPK
jgi:alpha-tubulin suppressor-like RCC1 family protein